MSELSAKQQALLEKLLKGQVSEKLKVEKIPKREIHSPVLLSFAQQRLWVLDRLVPGNPFYNLPTAVGFPGEIDIEVFEQTLNELGRRHESLRTVFSADEETEEPVQVILPELKIKTGIIDLGHLSSAEQQKEAARLTGEEAGKPFDLGRGPLLRVNLLRLGKKKNVLLFTMHHIISDAWSVDVFMGELAAIYEAFAAGKPSPLAEPPAQYADFAVWQRQWMQGEVLEKQLAYWKELLGGELPILELPADRQRPAVPSYRGSIQYIDLPGPVTAKIIELNRREKCSMFMTLLAALNVLLYRYSGQDDILVGSPIANRNRAELEKMIGFFANTLVFRTDLSGTPTFRELLARVRRVTSGAYDNQDLPFEKLVEEFQPDRYMSHTPFFQVMFNYKGIAEKKKDSSSTANGSAGQGISELPVHNQTSKFDLWITLHQEGNNLGGGFEYNTDIFEDATITRLIENFQTLMAGVAADPDQRIADLPVLPGEEKKRILVEWNDTGKEYHIRCLHHAFEDRAARVPEQTALIFAGKEMTYAQLNREAGQLAHYLLETGVKSGMPVGIAMERSFEMVIAMMGILKAGGAYLPLDPEYPPERLTFMMADARLSILLVLEPVLKTLPPLAEHIRVICMDRDTYRGTVSPDPAAALTVRDTAYIIYTSGSTGRPKGVMVPHEGISNRLHWMQEAYGLNAEDRVLQKTPYSFDVSVWEFFWPLLTGAIMVIAKPGGHKDSAYLVEIINEQKITTMHFVPTMLNVFLEDPSLEKEKVRSLKRVICSGEALPAEYRDRFFARMDEVTELHNLYGPTEASVDVTSWACDRRDSRHIVPIGRPIANTYIYILDHQLNPVPTGAHGELHIGGIQLAHGYLNRPELTMDKFCLRRAGGLILKKPPPCTPRKNFYKQKFCGGAGGGFSKEPPARRRHKLYKTGDLGRWLQDGSIEFIGRLDFQVKVRGFRIELGEIESNLRNHPALEDAAVLAREDAPGSEGKKLAGYVVPRHDYFDLSGEQVTDWQGVFDDTYTKDPGREDPLFNIIGWNSSYTGQPIPAEEMRLWVDSTVERILALEPRDVLEIGCGTGLFLFRIIPYCQRYLGTDIARQGLDYIRKQLEQLEIKHGDVDLLQRGAENFEGIEKESMDLVIINSVVQYFPSIEYLLKILEGAVESVKPGGHIFIGDVRSLPLLKTFCASVEFYKAEPAAAREELNRQVINRLSLEQELVIDPRFFIALKDLLPRRIKQVDLLLKHGRCANELSKFRYDVILHIDDGEYPDTWPTLFLDWKREKLRLPELRQRIIEWGEEESVVIGGVPNARIAEDLQVLKWLSGTDDPATAGEFRKILDEWKKKETAVDPEDFLELAGEIPYDIAITLSITDIGSYNVIFTHRDKKSTSQRNPSLEPVQPETSQWSGYANNPLLVKISGRLIPELRGFLKERLPEYMVPAQFVLLENLPLTSNGKLDRRALPEPLQIVRALEKDFVEPSDELETLFAGIWSEVLNVEKVGVTNNFFELGGDSIKAIQVISRANKKGFQLTVQHLYQNQNIAELAKTAEKIQPVEIDTKAIEEFQEGLDKEKILRQLPPGTEVEDILPVTPLQRHMLECLDNLTEPDPGLFLIQKSNLPQPINLDPNVLQEVLDKVTANRSLLRTVFVWKDLEEPVQVICKEGKTPLIYEDWSRFSPKKQKRKFEKLIKEQWHMGYDRTKPTALRMVFIKLAEGSFIYFFTSDYVRFDGWSSGIIQYEIINCYVARDMGRDLELKKENYYRHYLGTLRKQDMKTAEKFWCSVLRGYNGPPSLIDKFPCNKQGKARGFARQKIYYSPETTGGIDAFLTRNRLVYSVLIYAVWGMLLSSYADKNDVVFGVAYSGRNIASADVESMVGSSINVLPVRLKINPGNLLLNWLKEIFHQQAEANKYEYAPIETIKEWCGIPPERPLFDNYIVMQNLPTPNFRDHIADKEYLQTVAEPVFGTDDKRFIEIPDRLKEHHLFFAKMEYPLRVDIYMPSQLCPVFNYERRYLADSVIKGYMENMQILLENIVKNPHQTVGELMDLIDPKKYPKPKNLRDVEFV